MGDAERIAHTLVGGRNDLLERVRERMQLLCVVLKTTAPHQAGYGLVWRGSLTC